ncbi:hypothetical protein ACFC0M_32070 [Streptomyces sp. NPDC056149]|uniref:hypothetical protein n=1 Tax=unclassified Streptomyces TaxID=2593676 RepID=UPI00238186BB|nr:hypothetical protein [Streptomyces sp. WZ-12]
MRFKGYGTRAVWATWSTVTALSVAAVVSVSGCSAEQKAPDVAGGGGAGTSGKPKDQRAVRQQWVDCMHQEGQTGVTIGPKGEIQVPAGGAEGKNGGADNSAYDQAEKTCNAKVPGMQQVREQGKQKAIEQARKYVACLRENGYTDAPDPDPKTGVIVVDPKKWDKAKFGVAAKACTKVPGPGIQVAS